MTVRGIEAITLCMPPTKEAINTNVKEERDCASHNSKLSMTSVDRYKQEWTRLLKFCDECPENIRELSFNGELKISKFRCIYWALLLRVLNADYRNWYEQRQQQRQRYEKLGHEFMKNPHAIDVHNDDPLSQSTESVWNQYFSDQELFAVIRQDVIRTFPGVDFFRKPTIQNAMTNILFYYAREHPYMGYRQGMHEILAPILFVSFSDHQSFLHYKDISKNVDIDAILMAALNPDYLEADSYSIFARLMSSIQSYYRVTNLVQTPSGHFVALTDSIDTSHILSTELEVVGQLNLIREKILAKEDLHLHNYLLKLEIPLHIFGIRWLRLLFGREFALLDLLVLWDAIFADSDRFDLPNYVLVAMLIRIRDKLLLSDYTTCLTYLMRYPQNVDINLILRHALHMQMPKKFERPTNAFIYFTVSANASQSSISPNSVMTKKNSAIATTMSSAFNALVQQRSSSSLNDVHGGKIEQQITQLQTQNAASSAALTRLNMSCTEATDRVIMDGYDANSPELMRLELKNAQTVIKIARNKLQMYLATVRQHVGNKNRNKSNNHEHLERALDGIEELCSFLDVKFIFPLHAHAAPIDKALEANELQQQLLVNKMELAGNRDIDQQAYDVLTETIAGSTKYSGESSTCAKYEKPDRELFYSTHLLGAAKEFELMQIATDEKILSPTSPSNNRNQSNGLPIADPLSHYNC